jgi:hypothetical protein
LFRLSEGIFTVETAAQELRRKFREGFLEFVHNAKRSVDFYNTMAVKYTEASFKKHPIRETIPLI